MVTLMPLMLSFFKNYYGFYIVVGEVKNLFLRFKVKFFSKKKC